MTNLTRSRVFDDSSPNQFQECSVLLFEATTMFRRHTREILGDVGFKNIIDTGDFAVFHKEISTGRFDLVIGDAGNDGDDLCEVIRLLRHNSVGHDPFLGVIMTMTQTTDDNVRRAVKSGIDHLIVKPYAPEQVFRRIRSLIDHRQHFAVSLDYIGPDRRKNTRDDHPPEAILVPNALRAKVRNDPEAAATPETIDAALRKINDLRARHYDLEIGILVEMLRSGENTLTPERRTTRLKRLSTMLSSLRRILPNTGCVHAESMSRAPARIVNELLAGRRPVKPEDLKQLEEATMALHLCFQPEKTISMITSEIVDAVSRVDQIELNEVA